MAQGAMCALCEHCACLDSSSVALCVELARGGETEIVSHSSKPHTLHQFWEPMQISIRAQRYVFGEESTQLGRKVSPSILGLIPPKEAFLPTHTPTSVPKCLQVRLK